MNSMPQQAAANVVREIQALHAKLGTEEKKVLVALLVQAGNGGKINQSVELDFAPDLSVLLRGAPQTACW